MSRAQESCVPRAAPDRAVYPELRTNSNVPKCRIPESCARKNGVLKSCTRQSRLQRQLNQDDKTQADLFQKDKVLMEAHANINAQMDEHFRTLAVKKDKLQELKMEFSALVDERDELIAVNLNLQDNIEPRAE
ncbi:hypothetical protein GGH96_002206 [Coemansia sp. RSA 1972]|nr:hypothetical protein GGH96_002206 [Coemansia sp. RSA 1972]